MFKILSIAALSVGLATSAMAGGGDAGGEGGGPNGSGTHAGSSLDGGSTNTVFAPDRTTTGSVNGVAGSTSHRIKSRNCAGSTAKSVSPSTIHDTDACL